MNVHLCRQVEAGALEHPWPEQRVEIRNVFADEMVNFGRFVTPPLIKVLAVRVAPLPGGGHVADGSIEPDIPEVARRVRDLEAEIRGRSRDVPVTKRVAEEVSFEIVRDFQLEMVARLSPLVEESVKLFQLDKQVRRRAELRSRARQRTLRIFQVGWRVRPRALAAIVTWLIFSPASWIRAGSPHEAVRQKSARFRIEELFDLLFFDEPRVPDRLPELSTQFAVLFAVCAAVIVELDVESSEIPDVSVPHFGNECFLAAAFFPRPNHDRRAVRIVGAEVDALVASQFLEAHPDVRLDVLDQMPDVDVPVGVGQGGCNEDSSLSHFERIFTVKAGQPEAASGRDNCRSPNVVPRGGIVGRIGYSAERREPPGFAWGKQAPSGLRKKALNYPRRLAVLPQEVRRVQTVLRLFCSVDHGRC